MAWLLKIVREPLVHFALLGAGLFALSHVLHPTERSPLGKERLEITRGTIENLTQTYRANFGRAPSPDELSQLVRDYVDDELLYRRGLELGFDRDDIVMRKRLRQKVELFVESDSDASPPSDAELGLWLGAHAEQYRHEPRFTFRQLYIGSFADADLPKRAERMLRVVRAGGDATSLAAESQLPRDNVAIELSEVGRRFGVELGAHLVDAPTGVWLEPVSSGFGQHLIFLEKREAGRVPALDEVRAEVERDVRVDRAHRAQAKYLEALRAHYDVVVDLPKDSAAVAHAEPGAEP